MLKCYSSSSSFGVYFKRREKVGNACGICEKRHLRGERRKGRRETSVLLSLSIFLGEENKKKEKDKLKIESTGDSKRRKTKTKIETAFLFLSFTHRNYPK